MNKAEMNRIFDVLDEMFPDAKCELDYTTPLELLIAVMLSAQTTDISVNKLTKKLFVKYQSVYDYANASLEELQNDIKTIGLYRNKAKNILLMSQKLIEEYNGEVPQDHEALMSLPGVGRKTANVVMSEGFKEPYIAVDTHVERISKRLKFALKKDSVLEVEKKLMKRVPKDRWIKTHHQLIFFGRYHCKAINPDCANCKLIDLCSERKRKQYLKG